MASTPTPTVLTPDCVDIIEVIRDILARVFDTRLQLARAPVAAHRKIALILSGARVRFDPEPDTPS